MFTKLHVPAIILSFIKISTVLSKPISEKFLVTPGIPPQLEEYVIEDKHGKLKIDKKAYNFDVHEFNRKVRRFNRVKGRQAKARAGAETKADITTQYQGRTFL